jgi:pantetheine-phosphate adenylyltransferase
MSHLRVALNTEGSHVMNDAAATSRPPRIAVYAGVFDPPTMAHVEIVESALRIFDQLTVIVAFNVNKASALFSPDERVELFEASLGEDVRARVKVTSYSGLIAPHAEQMGACALVRGVRPYADFDSELALSLINQKLAPKLPTVLLFTSEKNMYLSSSFVRETAQLGGLIVPGSVSKAVEAALQRRFGPLHESGAQAWPGSAPP